MGFFTFPGEQEHRRFNYKPLYYDKEEEERRQKFGKVDGTFEKEKEKGEYVPGSYIRGSLREGNYARRTTVATKAQKIISPARMAMQVSITAICTADFARLV